MTAPPKELSSLRHNRQFLIILLFSLVTIVVWVSISLITSQTKTSISPELQKLAIPLNPSINVQVLEQIEEKRAYDPSQLSSFPIYLLTTDVPTRPTIQSVPRPTPSPSPTVSEIEAPASSASTELQNPDLL